MRKGKRDRKDDGFITKEIEKFEEKIDRLRDQ